MILSVLVLDFHINLKINMKTSIWILIKITSNSYNWSDDTDLPTHENPIILHLFWCLMIHLFGFFFFFFGFNIPDENFFIKPYFLLYYYYIGLYILLLHYIINTTITMFHCSDFGFLQLAT